MRWLLAARAHVPILVSKDVMDAAGVIPEEDVQNQRPAPDAPKAAASEEPEADIILRTPVGF